MVFLLLCPGKDLPILAFHAESDRHGPQCLPVILQAAAAFSAGDYRKRTRGFAHRVFA